MGRDAVHQVLASDVALDKLGAWGISAEEAEQLPRNQHHTVRTHAKLASRASGGC
jgi:hypothetical protein